MSNERKRERQKTRRRPGNAQESNSEQLDSTQHTANSSSAEASGDSVERTGRARVIGAAAVAIAVAVVGAFALFGAGGNGAAGDVITEAETQSRVEAHQALLATPGLPVRLVGADEVDDALASLPDNVTSEQREEMRQEISQGGLQLAWVTLWDTHAEDGDILRFESTTSIPIEVMALNAKTTFAIPYPADGQVLVTGVIDGGGGITIALESGATSIAWPTMAPGDQLLLPITPGF